MICVSSVSSMAPKRTVTGVLGVAARAFVAGVPGVGGGGRRIMVTRVGVVRVLGHSAIIRGVRSVVIVLARHVVSSPALVTNG